MHEIQIFEKIDPPYRYIFSQHNYQTMDLINTGI